MNNIYGYLVNRLGLTTDCAVKEAQKAYARFQEHGRTLTPVRVCDPFVFLFASGGYQAFTFKPDQVVEDKQGELAIVTGWKSTPSHGWLVRIKTARSEYDSCAEDLTPAAFPEGLVDILRGKVHDKVDEAFAHKQGTNRDYQA